MDSGIEMLSGEYNNTLDEKGRIQFPAKLRSVLHQESLVVTQGLDRCLMIFTPEEWEGLNRKIIEAASLFNDQNRLVMRRFIAPAQKIDFDKSGRLSIPQTLRDYAGLKGECTILGLNKYIELWDSESYHLYLDDTKDQFVKATESMGNILL